MNKSFLRFLMVRFGLRIMQLGILSVTVAMCLIVWWSLAGKPGNQADTMQLLLGFGFGAPAVLFCLGSFPLVAAPTSCGARKFAVLIVLLAHCQLALGLFALPLLFLVIPAMITLGVGVLMHVCFLLYLNRLSQLTARSDLHSNTTGQLVRLVTVPAGLLLISAAVFALVPQQAPQLTETVWSTTGVIFLWKYIVLISSVGSALRERYHAGSSLPQESMGSLPL